MRAVHFPTRSKAVAVAAVAAAFALPTLALAQGAAPSIPVRQLGTTTVSSAPIFTRVGNVRQLSDGRVLVNDLTMRQVVMLDANLANPVVIFDSVAGKANSYGTGPSGLIPFTGDSSLFAERTSKSFVVIDANGKIARVMPIPGVSTYLYVTSPGLYGYPAVSPKFGLVFQSPPRLTPPPRPAADAPEIKFVSGDSFPVLGIHLDTRAVDTVVKVPTGRATVQYISATGIRSEATSANAALFTVSDTWAVASDGSIAILRGHEYRIDWLNPDGTRTASPRLPFDWQHNTDADKIRIADSISVQFRKTDSASLKRFIDDSTKAANAPPAPPTAAQASLAASLASVQASAAAAGSSVDPSTLQLLNSLLAPNRTRPKPRPPMEPTDIPEYMPAIQGTADVLRADADNRLWIRPKQTIVSAAAPAGLAVTSPGLSVAPPGTIYDIVDRKGALIDRVQIPAGKTLVGFGPGGIVYLTSRDASKTILERAKFK